MSNFGWDTGNHMIDRDVQLGLPDGRDGQCDECGSDYGKEVLLCVDVMDETDPQTCEGCECAAGCKGRAWFFKCDECGHLTQLDQSKGIPNGGLV